LGISNGFDEKSKGFVQNADFKNIPNRIDFNYVDIELLCRRDNRELQLHFPIVENERLLVGQNIVDNQMSHVQLSEIVNQNLVISQNYFGIAFATLGELGRQKQIVTVVGLMNRFDQFWTTATVGLVQNQNFFHVQGVAQQ
jgi:hypothetical protein